MIGFVCLCAAFFAMLTLIALRVRVGSRFYRGMRRAVCAAAALAVSGLISPVGVNLLNLLCVSALGLPGLGLLHVIARMPEACTMSKPAARAMRFITARPTPDSG